MEGPIRVLHVVVNMNRGGAETLIMNLYRNLDPKKVQFDFLTCKEGVFDQEIQEMGGNIHRIPYISDVGHAGYMKALRHFFTNHKHYKIVHSHMDKMSGLVLRAAKMAGIPVRISHSHNTSCEGGIAAKLYKSFAGSFINKSATDLLACSNSAAEWLFKNRNHQVKIINNGINYQRFLFNPKTREKVRTFLNVDESTLVLGHVGRFFEQKNHSFLIEIFREVNKRNPNSVLVLVGNGSLMSEIYQKVDEYGLNGKVKFLGVRSDVEQLYQAFDLFIFPSIHEGLPVTLIEVQASGMPSLISDTITNEVDLGLGLIEYLPINDIGKWVKAIANYSNHHNRKITSNVFEEKGYDIRKTAASIQEYYLRISG